MTQHVDPKPKRAIVATVTQKRASFDAKAYLGRGKREELRRFVRDEAEPDQEPRADIVLVDHEISPSQTFTSATGARSATASPSCSRSSTRWPSSAGRSARGARSARGLQQDRARRRRSRAGRARSVAARPWSAQNLRGEIFASCKVLEERAGDEGAFLRIRGAPAAIKRLREQFGRVKEK